MISRGTRLNSETLREIRYINSLAKGEIKKMKYVYIQKIIVGIGIILAIFGPIFCGQRYWDYKISQERKDFDNGVEYYTEYYQTGKKYDEIIKQKEQTEANIQKAKIITCFSVVGSIFIGVLIIKKSNKIAEKFATKI